MKISSIPKRISRLWLSLWYRPIRVFCFHQVSDVFESDTMWECDWTQTEQFKRRILALKKEYTFISLPEVTAHLNKDLFRRKKYAALTSDDGWASLKNILPWLAEQKIPVTLFLNPLYFDGVHHQSRETEQLLSGEEIQEIVNTYSPYVSIASHGWKHESCKGLPIGEFEEKARMAELALAGLDGKIPFYAFAYGFYYEEELDSLRKMGLTPVLMDGEMNYSDGSFIHRELLDGNILVLR